MKYFLDTIETIEPGHGFTHFDGYHFLWLGVLVVFAGLMAWQYRKRDAETRAKWRKWVAVAILLDEVWKMFWLTVGGTYTLTGDQAAEVALQLQPRAVIPMHYRGDGFGFDDISTLEPFLSHFDEKQITFLRGNTLELTAQQPCGVIVPAFGE